MLVCHSITAMACTVEMSSMWAQCVVDQAEEPRVAGSRPSRDKNMEGTLPHPQTARIDHALTPQQQQQKKAKQLTEWKFISIPMNQSFYSIKNSLETHNSPFSRGVKIILADGNYSKDIQGSNQNF